MNKLQGDRVVPSNKVADYLLNPAHEQGAGKAKFFLQYGFQVGAAEVLAAALDLHARENCVEEIVPTPYGSKSVIRCTLRTPDNRNPCILVVWIQETGRSHHTLVTAYPSA